MQEVVGVSDAVNEAIRYLEFLMFSALNSLAESIQQYMLDDGAWRLAADANHQGEKERVGVVFQEVHLRMMEGLGERRIARRPTAQVVAADENW